MLNNLLNFKYLFERIWFFAVNRRQLPNQKGFALLLDAFRSKQSFYKKKIY